MKQNRFSVKVLKFDGTFWNAKLVETRVIEMVDFIIEGAYNSSEIIEK